MSDIHLNFNRTRRPRYLVFTSAGDNTSIRHWLSGPRDFDLWITYYGDDGDRYKQYCEIYNMRKAGKFQNLAFVYERYPEVLNQYDAIFVADDDMILSASSINRLFRIREEHDLWLLQPAFDPSGIASHPVTMAQPFSYLRYTNFVECGCPLFRKDKLDGFMREYDSSLVGTGIDFWYMSTLGEGIERKVAVVDAVRCVNPGRWIKGGEREIDLIEDRTRRGSAWAAKKKQLGLPADNPELVQFGRIRKPLSLGLISNSLRLLFVRLMTWFVRIPAVKLLAKSFLTRTIWRPTDGRPGVDR